MAILYSTHALRRMFQRALSAQAVEQVLAGGQVIANYPDDQPYPSRLLLGWVNEQAIHVVAADNEAGDTVVITAYVPEAALWNTSFTRKLP